MGVFGKLQQIQNSAAVKKNSYNDFGKYNYISFEKMLSAIKPEVKKAGCVLYMSNELVNIGDRNYVKATVTLVDLETEQTVSSSAYAREDQSEKGKNGCQITASCSTYARKNAIMGLFCIDGESNDSNSEFDDEDLALIAARRKADLLKVIRATYSENKISEIAKHYGLDDVSEMSNDDVEDYINLLNAKEKKK